MSTLTERFLEFCRTFAGGESVDTLPLSPSQTGLHLQRADYLFEQRSIICEIKTLAADPTEKLVAVMAEHGVHPSALGAGRHIVEDLFAKLPKGRNLYRRTVKKITKSIDKGLDDATRQIRDTKQLLRIASADGLAIFLNEHVTLLGHVFFEERLRLALEKIASDGTPYHNHITSVLYISEAAIIGDDAGKGWTLNTFYDNRAVPERHAVRQFIHRLMQAWAAHNGLAFRRGDDDERLQELMRVSKLAVDVKSDAGAG